MQFLLNLLFSKKFFGCEIAILMVALMAGFSHPKHVWIIGFYTLFALVFSRLVKTYLQEEEV